MRKVLTDVFIKALPSPAAGRIEVVDIKSTGLAFRVTSNGAKSWCLRFRDPRTGKTSRATIGTYPDISLADARERADSMRRQIAAGSHPVEPQAKSETVSATLDRFVTEYVRNAGRPLRSGYTIESTFDRLVKPRIGEINVRS